MHPQITLAREISKKAHAEQFRRDGITPYIEHPLAVAERVATTFPDDWIRYSIALLHDVLEDCEGWTAARLYDEGVDYRVVLGVIAITKRDGETLEKYWTRVKENVFARSVKIQDMLSNLADDPTPRQIKKYAKGLVFLLD